MLTDAKGATIVFVPGYINSAQVRVMSPDELFDMGVSHIDAARAGQTENPDVQEAWGRALLYRAFGMLGVSPDKVNY